MPFRVICANLFIFLAYSNLAIAESQNVKLLNAMSLCSSNPNCSHEKITAAGTIVFNLQRRGQVKHVVCQKDGTCMMIMSRGKKMIISDVGVLLAVK